MWMGFISWTMVTNEVITNSIKAAGFGEISEWMIYKHDLYGQDFLSEWLLNYNDDQGRINEELDEEVDEVVEDYEVVNLIDEEWLDF